MGVKESNLLRNVTFSSFLPNVSFYTKYNLTDDFFNHLNDNMITSMLPTLIYIGMLILIGLVGNTLVFVVYYKRFKPSPTRTYILAMSICDLLSNSIALPGDILEVRYFYTFDLPELCKSIRFVKSFLTMFSSFILVAVAVDRHHKICQPFKKQCITHSTFAAITGSAVTALVITIPYGILISRQTVETGIANVTGVRCSVDDVYVKSTFATVYNSFTIFGFATCVFMLTVCYTRIARKLWVHKKQTAIAIATAPVSSSNDCCVHERSDDSQEKHSGRKGGVGTSSKRPQNTNSCTTSDNKNVVLMRVRDSSAVDHSDSSGSTSGEKEEKRITSELESDLKDSGVGESVEDSHVSASNDGKSIHFSSFPHTHRSSQQITTSEKLSKSQNTKQNRFPSKHGSVKKIPSSTTFMMFVLTAVFVINYLPYLIIALTMSGQYVSPDTMSYVTFNLYHIALRSYFVNCAINPIVYSFCSARFRYEFCRLMHVWLK